jgi:hypothetical protein
MKEFKKNSWLRGKEQTTSSKNGKRIKLSDEWLKSLLKSFNRVKKELSIA